MITYQSLVHLKSFANLHFVMELIINQSYMCKNKVCSKPSVSKQLHYHTLTAKHSNFAKVGLFVKKKREVSWFHTEHKLRRPLFWFSSNLALLPKTIKTAVDSTKKFQPRIVRNISWNQLQCRVLPKVKQNMIIPMSNTDERAWSCISRFTHVSS